MSFISRVINFAKGIFYDNTTSGLTATNVSDALDEVVTLVGGVTHPVYTIDIIANELKLYKDAVEVGSEDLSLYLDDTNLARITSGTVDGLGIATFTRDDATTFTIDFSTFFDDTNLPRVTSGAVVGNDIVLTRDDASTVTVDVTSLIGGGGSDVKAGEVLKVSFTGNPKVATVTFATAFANTDYSIQLTSNVANANASYVLTYYNKTVNGFEISTGTNSISDLVSVDWIATIYNNA